MKHPQEITLVLGGARSGKSRFAESVVRDSGLERVYVATGEALDDEMRERIAHHRRQRDGDGWRTIEEPLEITEIITRQAAPTTALLVDCLTLWLTNVMHAARDIDAAQRQLIAALTQANGPVVLVSNEIGLGVVPETPMGRVFRDAQGRLNQAVAAIATRVVFVAAGLPLALKG